MLAIWGRQHDRIQSIEFFSALLLVLASVKGLREYSASIVPFVSQRHGAGLLEQNLALLQLFVT